MKARELESHIATGECDLILEAREKQQRETAKKVAQERERQELLAKRKAEPSTAEKARQKESEEEIKKRLKKEQDKIKKQAKKFF